MCAALAVVSAGAGWCQGAAGGIVDEPAPFSLPTPLLSPPAKTSVTIDGQKITVKYGAPSIRKRVIFGGLVPYHQVWRAGANDATALHTTADLQIEGLPVPKGDYTLFVWPDPKQWLLIINKQTGQSGLEYHQDRDLGRVPMRMGTLPKPLETYKMTLSRTGVNLGELRLAWERTVATVGLTVER